MRTTNREKRYSTLAIVASFRLEVARGSIARRENGGQADRRGGGEGGGGKKEKKGNEANARSRVHCARPRLQRPRRKQKFRPMCEPLFAGSLEGTGFR